mmetsp:Transcript_111956/g.316450  ORF Transcript_111956/g.316450 Transcript_111956/m.316450 type:complete len:667 (-) Transcript_111956:118-2118(-)
MDIVTLPQVPKAGAPYDVSAAVARRVSATSSVQRWPSRRSRASGGSRWRGACGSEQHPAHLPIQPVWPGPLATTTRELNAARSIIETVQPGLHADQRVEEISRLETWTCKLEGSDSFAEAADVLEHAVESRRRLFGDTDPRYHAAVECFVARCNTWSLRCLDSGRHLLALELLKRADATIVARPHITTLVPLRLLTLHNMCHFFKTRAKLRAALQASERAARLARRQWELCGTRAAASILGYAVLLSAHGRHREAASHIEIVWDSYLQEERELWQLVQTHQGVACPGGAFVDDHGSTEAADGCETETQHQEAAGILGVAGCNLWLELRLLGQASAATDCLREATQIAQLRLRSDHPCAKLIQAFLNAARRALTASDAAGTASRLLPYPQTTTALPVLRDCAGGARRGESADDAANRLVEAADRLVEARITLRRAGMGGVAPAAQSITSARSTRDPPFGPMAKAVVYGRLAIPPPTVDAKSHWSARLLEAPKDAEASLGYVGGPALQQQAYGAQPQALAHTPRGPAGCGGGHKPAIEVEAETYAGAERLAAVELMKAELARLNGATGTGDSASQHSRPLFHAPERERAAIRIQAWSRGVFARSESAKTAASQGWPDRKLHVVADVAERSPDTVVENQAALHLQRIWRGCWARRHFLPEVTTLGEQSA